MDDYYSLLGIDADASVDDIRGAYRLRKDGLDTATDAGKADAAKLNKAWNVLSDPYQRGRYDEKRAEAADRGGVDEGDEDASSNGSSAKSSATGFKGLQASAKSSRQERAQSTRDARAARLNKTPTIALPPGTSWPSTRQRIVAMVTDLAVLLLIVFTISSFGGQAFAKSQKPDIVKTVDARNSDITKASKVKSDADARVSADKKANNTAAQATDQKASDAAKTQITNLTKQRDDAFAKLNGYYTAATALAFLVGFLYLAIPTAISGRTLGKRLQHLKTLREDGTPLGLGGAAVRYGLVVGVTFAFSLVLQQLAAVIVLFGVTMWMRNPNMQGLHDRLAHTIVVREAD
jgi:curved DNA-binding protein CbpA